MAEDELEVAYMKIIGTVLLAMTLVIMSAGLIQARQVDFDDGIPDLSKENEDQDKTEEIQDSPDKVLKDSHEDMGQEELDKPRNVHRV